MSNKQAQDVLRHTFKQLQTMLDEVRRQEKDPRQSRRSAGERHEDRKPVTGAPAERKKAG